MTAVRAALAALRNGIRGEYDLLENALSLGGTTAVTAVLGVGYWWVAARMLSTSSVGYGSAAIAAMTLLATFGMVGYGSLLLGHVIASGPERGGLIATGLIVAAVVSFLSGITYGLVAPAVSNDFAPYVATLSGLLLFAVGVALSSAGTVLDDALLGLFLGRVQLTRNTAFGALKLAALAIFAVLLPDAAGLDVVGSWVVGAGLSLALVAVLLTRRGKRILHAPQLRALRTSARTAMLHHWINLATAGPRTALPLVVTATLSATANGSFYPAWMLATLVYLVPTHLATSLFAVGAFDRSALGAKTRSSIKFSIAVGVPLSIGLALIAHPVLRVLGASYAANATVPFQLLMLAYLPNIVRIHYVTVLRVEERLVRAASVMTLLAAIELAAAGLGAELGGLNGMAIALVVAMWLEAAVTLGPVARVTSWSR